MLFLVNKDHLEILKKGVEVWNKWRQNNPSAKPDFFEADLTGTHFTNANLSEANFSKAKLSKTDLSRGSLRDADLREADLTNAYLVDTSFRGADLSKTKLSETLLLKADLSHADLTEADLSKTSLDDANLFKANLTKTKLCKADLRGADLFEADLTKADLTNANLSKANLTGAILTEAELSGAFLSDADLSGADLSRANLSRADMMGTRMIQTKLNGAILTGCRVYGVSTWGLIGLDEAEQSNLVITHYKEPEITVDNLEVAQFIYLLLRSEKVRDVITTIGQKGVLVLGRFNERKHILDAIRAKLRSIGYIPFVFDFEKPTDRDFTETVKTLAGLSKFIIADITQPKSVSLEQQAIVPDYSIPMVTIIEKGEKPYSMFQDLWQKHRDWVLEPLSYTSAEQLQRVFQEAIVDRANHRLEDLRKRKAEEVCMQDASDYEK